MAKPVLYNGLGSPHSIYDVTTTQHHKVGTRGALSDGRVFYYATAKANSTALVAGNLLASEAASVDMDDMAADTPAAGQSVVNVTPVGTKTYAANELAEGYLTVQSGTGLGITYKIRSHAATTAATEFAVTIYDSFSVGLAAASTVVVAKNPWADPIVMPTTGAAQPAGVCNTAVAQDTSNAQYFWVQTWGVCSVTAGSASAVGDALMADTTTAGETLIATAGNPVIGNAYTLGVNADTVLAFLTIAP